MPRTGELLYYQNLGADGLRHALNKPFSDDNCGEDLLRIGALMSLLPPPPARVLECGCGTGWLSHLLHKRGYDVVATDVAPEAIRLAEENSMFCGDGGPRFCVADAETLPYDSEFDAVVFFDSLHHTLNEQEALRGAFRALRPGGVCITLEPGIGHAKHSKAISEHYDVTEKDMPPVYIRSLGRAAGFGKCHFYPAPQQLGMLLYKPQRINPRWLRGLFSVWPLSYLAAFYLMLFHKRYNGITVLHKPVS